MVAPDGSSKSAAKDRVVPIEKMQFTQAVPGVSKAVPWGDPAKGPYGAITRFTKGTKVAWHTHSHDIKAVVISGTSFMTPAAASSASVPVPSSRSAPASSTPRRRVLTPISSSSRREAARSTSRW